MLDRNKQSAQQAVQKVAAEKAAAEKAAVEKVAAEKKEAEKAAAEKAAAAKAAAEKVAVAAASSALRSAMAGTNTAALQQALLTAEVAGGVADELLLEASQEALAAFRCSCSSTPTPTACRIIATCGLDIRSGHGEWQAVLRACSDQHDAVGTAL